jgi:1-deoxy-D-xylulose-5-phosphate reductoisomerase
MTKRISILGSTGSIGVNALDVVRRLNNGNGNNSPFRIFGLSAQRNVEAIKTQIKEFKPGAVVVSDNGAAENLKTWARRNQPKLKVWQGPEGLERLASEKVDLLLSSVVGSVGLLPLLAAVKAGRTVALANKEALIVAGELITSEAKKSGAELIPVDSEHSAIFQCIQSTPRKQIKKLILTASGGAFYRRQGELDKVTVKEALNHPTWKMGNKITIDCATLMNKGLEAIEAHHLFGIPMEDIDIVVHPQSIIHSLVEFSDGAMLAQLSHPDMRLPIQYALTYPDRLPTPLKTLNLADVQKLEFYKPDFHRFPCLSLALSAGKRGGTWPAVLNGANEVAVRSFIEEKISFLDIPRIIRLVLAAYRPGKGADIATLDRILEADRWAREKASALTNREEALVPKRRNE